ncbi:MAG: hypothetical protein ABI333_00405 [bacterium]
MKRHLWILAAVLPLGACGASGGHQNYAPCQEGYEPSGPACIPIFEDCPGPAEVPVLGGGCQAVGVTSCATGLLESDGEGGCDPILPDHSCPPGTMEVLGQTECQPVGVTECAAGFASDGEGGCEAILPPEPCPPGAIALLGHAECQPLGDCGTGTWGNIADDGATVYVDHTADATGADGSQQAPFASIGEAVQATPDGGQIAVAAGDYTERLNLNRPLRLTGRCAALVTIRGTTFLGEPRAPITINSSGSGTTLSGVTLTGPAAGLVVLAAQQVVLRQVQIRDASDLGVVADEGAELRLQRVVVAGCATMGIISNGGTLDVEQSVVRGTWPQLGTNAFGRGISAQCYSPELCGTLRVSSSLVSGNRGEGISAIGVDTEVTATVVRDNLPEPGDGSAGRGINVQCLPPTGPCGSLRVLQSVVAGNRDTGIFSGGVDTEVISTVVRDTLPEQPSGSNGRGIEALCYSAGICGSLRVVASLVARNREAGIVVGSVDADVTATVVRDTLPEESGGDHGRGISGWRQFEAAVGGSLRVSSSLVTGNQEAGIASDGLDTEVTATVVRGTLPAQGSGMFGRGINVQCHSDDACGSLQVSSSIIEGNSDMGIVSGGVDVEISATVVRDTLPEQTSGMFGRGINALCFSAEACGRLQVTSSLVSGNRGVGVATHGVDTEVTATVVRDTLPEQSDATVGRGLSAQCSDDGVCGSLRVSSSLLSGNREVGVYTSGVEAELINTVVRDTQPQVSDGSGGRAITAQCGWAGTCGSLRLSGCLVTGSHEVGIGTIGVEADLTATVVRDTAAEQASGKFGVGLAAQCDYDANSCGSLRLVHSVIRSSETTGVYIYGMPSVLEGVAVYSTRSNGRGPWQGTFGQGIWVQCYPGPGGCGSFSMTSSLVDTSESAGLALEGISGFVSTSAIRSVGAQTLDDKYGYGIQIGGLEGEGLPTFNVNDCHIRDAKLAGILYYRALGALARTVVSGGENSVVMNEGSAPTILDGNDLSGTVQDEPTWANLFPSPAPPPTVPVATAD